MNKTQTLKLNWNLKSLLLFGLTAFFLQACTAASMRVEVEVYKGPLSKTTDIQKGELEAFIKETERGLKNFRNFYELSGSPEKFAQKLSQGAEIIEFSDIVTKNFGDTIIELHKEFETFSVEFSSTSDAFRNARKNLKTITNALNQAAELKNLHKKLLLKKEGGLETISLKSISDFTSKSPFPISSSTQEYLNFLRTKTNEIKVSGKTSLEIGTIQSKYEELDKKIATAIKQPFLSAKENLTVLETTFSNEKNNLNQILSEYKGTAIYNIATTEYSDKPKNLAKTIEGYTATLNRINKSNITLTKKASYLANRLKSTAFYWGSYSIFSSLPSGPRKIVTDFINMASQYANQIESRADALQKQLYPDEGRSKIPRENMPLSVYLRDTQPTDFINLYTWNHAVPIEPFDIMAFHPFESMSSERIGNKVRGFQHLFADQHWSKINSVYASGQGDLHMAFVKDEIGNWNLKSFDQDPTKILKAYSDLTRAVIKGVTDAVADGAGVGGAKASLDVLSKLAQGQLGSGGDPAKEVKINKLRDKVIKELEDLKSETKGKSPDLKKIKEDAKNALENYKDELKNL